jgi:hypothetical protein
MTITATPTPTETPVLFEELDRREADRIEVSLLWNRAANALTVFVSDARTGTCFELPVDAAESREVFEHPFAHAAYRGLEV